MRQVVQGLIGDFQLLCQFFQSIRGTIHPILHNGHLFEDVLKSIGRLAIFYESFGAASALGAMLDE